jgi:lysophospholipase L1-like esterase
MPTRNPLNRQSTAGIVGITGLLILLALWLTSSSRSSLNVQTGQAAVAFSADSGTVWLPGDCLIVRWHADGIREIYLNGQGIIGEGERRVCVDAQTMPTLRVKFLDGSQQDYNLPITILLISPVFWGAVVMIGWALIVLRAFWTRPIVATKRILRQSAFVRDLPKRLALAAIGVAVACLVLEFGLHFYFSRYGSKTDQIKYLMTREEIQNLNNILVPLPYVNYVPSPDYPEHNKLGYRGPDIAIPKPQGVYRIVALGGSTTYSSATTYPDSYPAQLQTILRAEGYGNVEVINAGFIGYTSWDTLTNFEFRVLELEPDMIILYDGVNDITPREQISVDCYRGHNILLGLNADRGFWTVQDAPLSTSVLYRVIAVNLGWIADPSAVNSAFELPKADCQLDNLPVDRRVAQNSPEYFERNVRNLILIAQGNHVQPVLSTWTYYANQPRPDYWREAVDENNGIIKSLAQEMRVPLYDLDANMPVKAEYWSADGIHMYPPGAHEQAQEYADFLVKQNLLPKP